MVKQGTIWSDGKDKFFRVLGVVEQDGHMWVHYREEFGIKIPVLECKEFSCYEESFVHRFSPIAE
jgi:hypothetical protein